MPPAALLTGLLRDVSRSFYLTLRILPGAIRSPIGLAYLLARATDTIADTEIVPVAQRLSTLHSLRDRILGRPSRLELGVLSQHQDSSAERLLLARMEEALAMLRALNQDDQQRIQQVLDIITSGQELDLRRFGNASAERLYALATDAELDDYTYRVAGCVGEFWTKTCLAHLFRRSGLDHTAVLAKSVRFGQGLQLVNILRDVPADLRRGRCYLPEQRLADAGLSPSDLLEAKNETRFHALYQSYLEQARAHLAVGWDYTNAWPRSSVRVRLACSWPILIGIRTLDLLHNASILEPEQRLKISRAEVRRIVFRTVVCYPWPSAWHRLFRATPPVSPHDPRSGLKSRP